MVPVLVNTRNNVVATGTKSVELEDYKVETGELKRLFTSLGDADEKVAILGQSKGFYLRYLVGEWHLKIVCRGFL